MQTRKLRRQCGGSRGKPAIPAGTIFGKEEKQGLWIRLGKDGKFLKKGDEGYYEIQWDGGWSRWWMLGQDGKLCHRNPNNNPEDMNDTGKDGKAGWKTYTMHGDAPAPEFMPAEEVVRCVAASLYKPQSYLGR